MGDAIGRDWPAKASARAALIAIATLFTFGPVRAQAEQAVAPTVGEKLPLGTAITGRCQPAQAPSGDGVVTRTHRWTAFQRSDHLAPLEPNDPDYPAYNHSQAILPSGRYNQGACEALESDSNQPTRVGGVPAFRVADAGRWFAYPIVAETEWEYDDQDYFDWVNLGTLNALIDAIHFEVYDPCYVIAQEVDGRVLKGRPGRRPRAVKPGTVIMQGDTLSVQRNGGKPGRVRVSNPQAGYSLGFGPGEYQFSDVRKCNEYLEQGRLAAQLPKEPTKPKVKKGVVDQAFDEFGAIIKAGKDLYNEGIFSKLKRASLPAMRGVGDQAQGRFKVVRRKGKTRSCALEGKLRVYTKRKSVPKRKREVLLSEGQCAVTKDGRAPRRVRR